MVTYVKLPKLTWTMEEGVIRRWLKKEGDEVKKGEPICEVETEKSLDELEAPESGVLRKIIVQEGSIAKVNQIIAIIGEADEPLPEELQVKEITSKPMAVEGETAEVQKPAVVVQEVEHEKVIPLTQIRKVIKDRLSYSLKTSLHVPLTIEVDMTTAIELLKSLGSEMEKTHNIRPSITSLLVKAVAKSLGEHPLLNSRLEDERIVISKDINIGVAVAIKNGLVVPVIHHANKKSIIEIAKSLNELAEKARKESLTTEESTGGTFTISNLGMFGIDFFAPIINPPESAILGVGRIVKKPVVFNDEITVRSMMTLTLVFDHRIMDGAAAAKFLQTLKKTLEENTQDLIETPNR